MRCVTGERMKPSSGLTADTTVTVTNRDLLITQTRKLFKRRAILIVN